MIAAIDQKTFAAAIGKTSSAVAQWEAGNSRPRDLVNVAKNIKMLTRVPATWLLGFDESPRGGAPAAGIRTIDLVDGDARTAGNDGVNVALYQLS